MHVATTVCLLKQQDDIVGAENNLIIVILTIFFLSVYYTFSIDFYTIFVRTIFDGIFLFNHIYRRVNC